MLHDVDDHQPEHGAEDDHDQQRADEGREATERTELVARHLLLPLAQDGPDPAIALVGLVVNSDEDLVNKVASIPGAVGVVDVYAINSSVAVVKIAGKLPLQPGYLLHGN